MPRLHARANSADVLSPAKQGCQSNVAWMHRMVCAEAADAEGSRRAGGAQQCGSTDFYGCGRGFALSGKLQTNLLPQKKIIWHEAMFFFVVFFLSSVTVLKLMLNLYGASISQRVWSQDTKQNVWLLFFKPIPL